MAEVLKLKLTGDSPAVRNRQRTEQCIVLTAAQALLDAGYSLGVYDGEEIVVHHSTDIHKIHEALFNTDEDYLFVYIKGDNEKDTRPQYWVKCVYGNDGWDVISDYTTKLERQVGEGSKVQKLSDYAEEHGTVLGFEGTVHTSGITV